MLLYCHQILQPESLYIKVLPAIISGFIVLILFIIGRIIDSKIRTKEISRTWYLRVIIEPNLKKVDDFMQNTSETVRLSISSLSAARDNNILYWEYIEAKAKEIGKFQLLKRNFEIGFIQLVQWNYPIIGAQLSESLRKLEDIVTSILDKQDLSIKDCEIIEKSITDYRNTLFYLLFSPIGNIK